MTKTIGLLGAVIGLLCIFPIFALNADGSFISYVFAAAIGYLFAVLTSKSDNAAIFSPSWGNMNENRVNELLEKIGEEARADVSLHIDAGRKLAAVKSFHKDGGTRLRDAKNAVEWMIEHRHR